MTEDAVVELERAVSRMAERVAGDAVKYAHHAGRIRRITKKDIMLTGTDSILDRLRETDPADARNITHAFAKKDKTP